jgi:hypothetical protein
VGFLDLFVKLALQTNQNWVEEPAVGALRRNVLSETPT